ncbi:MAG TPA: hypothetical protein VF116_17215 [Ktedonobacterales bacterium]
MILTVVVFSAFLICLTVLYVAIGMWLDAHGGARRWHVWVMSVIFYAAVVAGIIIAAQPRNLRVVGVGAGFGAAFGAVYGLFAKGPRPRSQRHQESQTRPRP